MLTALQRFLASAPPVDDGIVDTEVVRRRHQDSIRVAQALGYVPSTVEAQLLAEDGAS